MADPTYTIKLPIEVNNSNNFEYISDLLENTRQNLKMLILTSPGEKIMDPEYGLGIRKYLFDPVNGSVDTSRVDLGYVNINLKEHRQEIFIELTKQVNEYNPEIKIENIETDIQDNILFLKIYYNYKGFISDSLQMSINL